MSDQKKQQRWDETYMGFARAISQHSYDPKYRVGAVIVNDQAGTVVGLGYNGRGRGRPNERMSMETGKSAFIHAEMNAVAKVSWEMACTYTMYCTLAPCVVCAGLILNTPIKRVVIDQAYPADPAGVEELVAGLGAENVILLGR